MCEVYRRLHLHLVAPSIPGFGHSDSHPFGHTRRISEWADTMRQLLAQEKIDNFYIAGTSFGCMHAAAVAAAFPERVMGIALFTPTSPSEFDSEIGAQLAAATAVSILHIARVDITHYASHIAHSHTGGQVVAGEALHRRRALVGHVERLRRLRPAQGRARCARGARQDGGERCAAASRAQSAPHRPSTVGALPFVRAP